jgi:hypothetical protein
MRRGLPMRGDEMDCSGLAPYGAFLHFRMAGTRSPAVPSWRRRLLPTTIRQSTPMIHV